MIYASDTKNSKNINNKILRDEFSFFQNILD